jgi:hypothetical protein
MDAWEGAFSWQGYALEGRPDLLNYLHRGDATWEQVWELYRQRPTSPESVLRITGLFHAMLSSRYDGEGCHLDEEGDTYRQLRAWAAFAVERPDLLPEDRIQDGLARLGDSGLITDHYYTASYAVYTEALLDRFAASWAGPERDGKGPRGPADFPGARERQLAVYYPSLARYPALCSNPDWEQSMRSFLVAHYTSWNSVYAATYSGEQEIELGGEG